jgi:transcription-repair coupling factor (superfamily II helicase)
MIDRFGPITASCYMNSIRIKWIASRLGIERLVMKQGKMIGYFVSDQQMHYYKSNRFMAVMHLFKNQFVKIKKKKPRTACVVVDF